MIIYCGMNMNDVALRVRATLLSLSGPKYSTAFMIVSCMSRIYAGGDLACKHDCGPSVLDAVTPAYSTNSSDGMAS